MQTLRDALGYLLIPALLAIGAVMTLAAIPVLILEDAIRAIRKALR